MDHLITHRIIVDEFHNNKTNLLCFLIDFRKQFDTIPITNLWNILEKVRIPFELRVVVIRLYENAISMFRNIE